ncbi:MAG: putative lipid II flippase FtsW [Clostridia bacterium]|nr:putative lipid II flippase FtsW [Clostridia bacterium]
MKKREVDIKNKEEKSIDFGMFVIIIILLCVGLVMVSSASSYYALSTWGTSNYLLIRQLIFAIMGVAAMIIISKVDYKIYKKWSYLGYIIALLLLIAVLTPLGVTVNGAKRWLGFGTTLRFQPSEIMKLMLVLATSTYLSLNYKKLSNVKGYVIPGILLALVILVLFLQKHMSATLVMAVASVSVIFASGIKLKARWIFAFILLLGVIGTVFIFSEGFRLKRILAFMDIESDPTGTNWQALQSVYAISSGGMFGRGLGQSRQKYLWLPEAQNDFIFSVLGEELGFVGATCVVILFVLFIYRGYKIAITCKDMFGSLVATGITSVFALQIIINIAVVTVSMPVTGMPLPFFSYGGTALFINLCAMGVLLSISRNCRK